MVPVKFGRTSALAEEHVGVGEGGGRVRYIPRVGKSATLYLFPCVRGSAPLTFGSMCQWFGGSVDFFFVLLHFCYSLTHFFPFFLQLGRLVAVAVSLSGLFIGIRNVHSK